MQVLLVKEEKSTIDFITKRLEEALNIEIFTIDSLKELKTKIYTSDKKNLVIADIKSSTKTLDFLTKENIPTILTSSKNEKFCHDGADHIVDFISIQSPESLNYIISLIDQIHKNTTTKVLVVDNIKVDREKLTSFLKAQHFLTYSVSNPLKALQLMEQYSDIKIVITDINMPLLNGIEFLKIIRRNYSKQHLSVIGVSHDRDNSTHFLKYGANDFITKPFKKEEFNCRINNTAEALENISKLENIANLDFLTKVPNRKHFFEQANSHLESAKLTNQECAIAMIDIDNFKSINDTYGHDIGDKVIKALATLLSNNIKGHDIVARFGGEEFVLYIKDATKENSKKLLTDICKEVSKLTINISNNISIDFTVSIGLCTQLQDDIDQMIKTADNLLYHAKNSGKNRVISDFVLAV